MKDVIDIETLEVGYDIPALPGMDEADIQTPCLILDLDALERNIKKMGDYAKAHGMRHRVHGKMHKSVDVAKLQESLGGAVGVCCQKVSEAEVFARGGIKDVLVSNQVRDAAKIDRLARLPKLGARAICCVDDLANVADLSAAAVKHGTQIECLVEIDCGAGRCGVTTTPAVIEIAKAIDAAPGLKFAGLQAYQGAMQHLDSYDERMAKTTIAIDMVRDAVEGLKAEGLECDIVGGGGTGSYYFESNSGVYNELAVRFLRLHGCRLRPHPRQGRQAHRPGRMGKRAVHPDERHVPRQGRQGHRRCRVEGAIGRLGLAHHLRA
jgi:3-hydroxy-D-aspartate aldolase